MTTRLRLVAPVAAAVVLGWTMTACGADNGTAGDAATDATDSSSPTAFTDPSTDSASVSPSATSSAPASPTATAVDLPSCGSVWTTDARLPMGYDGCQQGSQAIDADKLPCSSGQSLVRFAPHYWAVAGGKVHRVAALNRDRDYLQAIAACRG